MGKHWHVCSTTYGSPYTMCMETVVTEYQLVPPYYGTPQTEPGTPNNYRDRMHYDKWQIQTILERKSGKTIQHRWVSFTLGTCTFYEGF